MINIWRAFISGIRVTVPHLRKGIMYFNQAIQLDSGYAKAYSGLADCYSALGYGSYEKPVNAFLKAEQAANKALQLDSTLADPHTSLGYIKLYYYWDLRGAQTGIPDGHTSESGLYNSL